MAFVQPSLLTNSLTSWSATRSNGIRQVPITYRCATSRRATMVLDKPETSSKPDTASPSIPEETNQPAEETQNMNAENILKDMRDDASKDTGPRSTNMGVTRDADGKSNIWALEPPSEVDTKPQVNKVAILGMVLVAVIFAVLLLPQLPFTNLDQL